MTTFDGQTMADTWVWEPRLSYFTVRYNVEEEIIHEVSVEERDLITQPTPPTKEGYRFIGWFTLPEGGIQWNFATMIMPRSDLTLYALFEREVSNNENNESNYQNDNRENYENNHNNYENEKESENNYIISGLLNTGDATRIFIYVILMVVAGVIIFIIIKNRKK